MGQIETKTDIGADGDRFENAWGATVQSRRLQFLRTLAGKKYLVVHEIHAKTPGFLLAVNSGMHGGEETSVVAALNICMEAVNELAFGSVVGLPIANPDSVAVGIRGVPYVVLGEASDLNRVILDKPNTLIEQHANTIFEVFRTAYKKNMTKLQSTSNIPPYAYAGLVLDFHTESGGGGSNSDDVLPYTRIDHTTDDTLLGFLIYCSELMGIPWVIEYPEAIYKEAELDNSLTGVLVQGGIPALTIELGPEGRTDTEFVAIGKAIAHRLFAHFKMRARDHKEDELMQGDWGQDPADLLKQVKKINSHGPLQLADAYCVDEEGNQLNALGFLEITAKPGEQVKRGQQIGLLTNPTKLRDNCTPVFAPFDGFVLSVAGSPNVRHQPGQLAYQAAIHLTDERITRIYHEQKMIFGIEI